MAKKRGSRQQLNGRNANGNSGSTVKFVVVIAVLIIGFASLFALGKGGSSGEGGAGTGASVGTEGQSVVSLEDEVKNLTEQVNKNPKDASLHESLGLALFNLANAYRDSNDPKANETLAKTIQVFNETLQFKPDSKETLGDLATAYFYSKQVDQAIASVEKALKIDPGFLPALMNYGIYLADGKGDYKNAVKQWEKIPAGTPQYDQAQSMINQYKNK